MTRRFSREDYAEHGPYGFGKPYSGKSPHNIETWNIISQAITRSDAKALSFESLEYLSRNHKHGTKTATKPYQFVTFCIRSGWLTPAGRKRRAIARQAGLPIHSMPGDLSSDVDL